MITSDFYKLIDSKLINLIEKYKDDSFLKKYKKDINNQKAYALLIWFLEFYGKKSNYKDFITEGNNDSSCDIIFDYTDNQGKKTFYIVQSKWNNLRNSNKETDRDEILKALSDFDTLVGGEQKILNKKLQGKLKELDKHLKGNGDVKFLFLSLSQYKGGADSNINSFLKNDDKRSFEVIDIDRIRKDYIDRNYKKIDPINPLIPYYNPEEHAIEIKIAHGGNFIKIEKPFEAYTILLRPKAVYELFDKYGFALFYKNVRNPLIQSQFNEQIEKTATENPAYFWYYNNGITAITYLLPTIGQQAEAVEVTGLQIINGAQTVYSIYRAYKNASPTKRKQMNADALVTLRLLRSGGKEFDLNVTRYTNSQNPVKDRDFCANDDIQVILQDRSYQTKFWYEKRRSEFREVPDGVVKVPNLVFANAYLAYHLQDPVSVLKNYTYRTHTNKDLNFISHKAHKDGLYEKIFNRDTVFEDMLSAFYVFDSVLKSIPYRYMETFKSNLYHLLALFKVAFQKYLNNKFENEVNINEYIRRIYEKDEKEIIIKTFKYLNEFVEKQIEVADNEEKTSERMLKFLFTLSHYEKIKDALEDTEILIEDIEDITLENIENIIDGEKLDEDEDTTDV